MKVTESELKQNIKSKNYSRVYVLDGTEKLHVKHYSEFIKEKIMGEAPSEFNYHIFDEYSELDDIAVAIGVVPFMEEYNFVVVTDYAIGSLKAEESEKLFEIIKSIPDTTIVLFDFPTKLKPTKDEAKKKYTKFIKACDKIGIVADFVQIEGKALEQMVVKGIYSRGGQITENTASLIINYVGTDMIALQNEMDKLCAYANGNEVTVEMVQQLIHQNLTTRIYNMSNAIIGGNLDKAYKELDILFSQDEKPLVLVATIAGAYVDLYRARVGLESGISNAIIAADFSYGNRTFLLSNAQKNSYNLSTNAIRDSLCAISDVDIKLKSTTEDPRITLEKLISELFLIAKGNRV